MKREPNHSQQWLIGEPPNARRIREGYEMTDRIRRRYLEIIAKERE